MKRQILNLLTVLSIIGAFSNTGICNDPDQNTPWPVGFDTTGMNTSRTLLNSYGDMNGSWEDGWFHGGIDIDATTGFFDCNEVRCVDAGYATEVEEIPIPGTQDETQWYVIICDELGGVVENGWAYEHLTQPSFSEEDYVAEGQLIGYMHDSVLSVPHVHFKWTDWDNVFYSYVNPLFYLNPAPIADSNYVWEFNPQNYDPPFEFFFLPQILYTDWDDLTVSATFDSILDPSNLTGCVDLFLGLSLRGDGMPLGQGIGRDDLAPQRIKWCTIRETSSGDQFIDTMYVVDFDCILSQNDIRFQMLYFKHTMLDMFGKNALLFCLSNCIYTDGWDGIDNIYEEAWKTNYNCEGTSVTENPILAAYLDGPYRLDVTYYSFDLDYDYSASIDVELHNFSPVVEKVILECEGRTIWVAYWTADGLIPEWHNPVDQRVLPDQELDLTVVFSEPMDTTSVTVTAGVSSPFSDITASDAGLDWGWTNCPEEPEYKDTWHGVFDDLTGCTSGRMIISIQAQDQDANGLTDPSVSVYDGRYNDTHHSFSVMGIQPGWPVTLEDVALSSPVLADLDDDGDLDVVIQSTDGYVHIFEDDGTAWTIWPVQSGGWLIDVISSPAIVDIDGGTLDILSVNAYGCHARDLSTGNNIDGWPVFMGDGGVLAGYYPSMSSPAVGDVDEDGFPEIVICRHLSSVSILEATVYMFEHTGGSKGVWTWVRNLEPSMDGSSVISTPSISDADGDGLLDVIVCTAEGFELGKDSSGDRSYNSGVYLLDPRNDGQTIWVKYFNTLFCASPVVADVDNDGINEIILGTKGGSDENKILVLSGDDGYPEHTFYLDGWVHGPVALGDLNDDGWLDIVASVEGGTIECWSGETYQDLDGFPLGIDDNPSSGPSIADIDGDFKLEIVIGTTEGNLYAINHDGTICSGYPVACGNGIYGQVAIGNIDDDNSLEMIFADDTDPVLYCYDLGAGTFPAEMPWRQFQHDSWHTGCFNADNTIPAPPTNLQGEHTDGTVVLTWVLSVNDPDHPEAEEPTDVISYQIYRGFPPYDPPFVIGRVHAGVGMYTDVYNPLGYPAVQYFVTAFDGTNESEFSNDVRFHTEALDVISLGCPVIEEFSTLRVLTRILQTSAPQITEESSHSEITPAHERTSETLSTVTDYAVPANGNPGCLTDGSVEVCYSPSAGADAVVIDLGEECTVTSVLPERVSGISLETTPVVEPSLLIEVAGSDREFYQFAAESRSSTEAVRYIRVTGASGLSEISVYGSRGVLDTVSSVEITRSAETDGWMFAIPLAERSEEAEIKIYDVSGRMIWSGYCESGSVLHWDGFTGNGTAAPNGVYLLHCSIGSEVSTGSFVVRRD